jgi:hypothetical protein
MKQKYFSEEVNEPTSETVIYESLGKSINQLVIISAILSPFKVWGIMPFMQ